MCRFHRRRKKSFKDSNVMYSIICIDFETKKMQTSMTVFGQQANHMDLTII